MVEVEKSSSAVDTMSGSDALLWTISADPVMRPTIVALMVLDGKPDWAEVRARVAELTEAVPRLRSRAVTRGPCRGRPQFVPDETFALNMHLRHMRLPELGVFRDVIDLAQTMATSGFDAASSVVGSRPRRGVGRQSIRPRHESPSRPHRRRRRPCRACPALRRRPTGVAHRRPDEAGSRGSRSPATSLSP